MHALAIAVAPNINLIRVTAEPFMALFFAEAKYERLLCGLFVTMQKMLCQHADGDRVNPFTVTVIKRGGHHESRTKDYLNYKYQGSSIIQKGIQRL